tara:strand:+ start:578 stop:1057 length:480 start_codon:yes stop_codon:yes gene_type:complete
MCSKIFIFIFSFLLFTNLYSAEIVIQGNSKVEYNDFTFTDNSKYIIINQEGQWTDNIGNYGSQKCKGLIKRNDKNIVNFLDVICQLTNQNNVVIWRKFERTGSEIERGVGVSTIIDSTSKHKKELIGTKCNYAVNRTKDMVFSKSVCKVSDELYKKLIQ